MLFQATENSDVATCEHMEALFNPLGLGMKRTEHKGVSRGGASWVDRRMSNAERLKTMHAPMVWQLTRHVVT